MSLRIKELLKERNMQVSELAGLIELSPQNLSKLINEKTKPSIDTFERIAIALNVPITELFEANKGFTALIDNNGTLYRTNSIEELERLITQIKGGL